MRYVEEISEVFLIVMLNISVRKQVSPIFSGSYNPFYAVDLNQ